MARMIPLVISPNTKSKAEIALFTTFEQDLPDTWIVLHSVGIASHRSKPWAELDFVLVGPMGVFCLEVKGGRVRREDGMWVFTNARNEESRKFEGPFAQVGGAAAALFRFLHDGDTRFRGMVAQGVMFPDITFGLEGPDVDLAIVYDVRNAGTDIRAYLRRIADRARARHTPVEMELSQPRCAQVVDALRGDFDFRLSLQRQADLINAELLSLTSEQYRVLDMLEANPRVLIEGSAGTGKTLLAVEEARRNARLGRKVLLCCFSRNLADFLGETLRDEPLVCVDNLHRIMISYIRQAGLLDSLPDASDSYLYEVAFPDACFEALATLDSFEPFDTLIVDEGQDLMLARYWDVFDVLLKGGITGGHLRVFYDPKQNLFDGIDGALPRIIAKASPATCNLSVNCRNTQPTSMNGALLCGRPLGRVAKPTGPESIIELFTGPEDQLKRLNKLVKSLQAGKLQSEQIVVLSPRAFVSSGLSLPGVTFKFHDITSGGRAQTGKVSFCTIAGFKGLEADVVLIIDLYALRGSEYASLVYVAVTRPRILLAAFVHNDIRDELEANARGLGTALVS